MRKVGIGFFLFRSVLFLLTLIVILIGADHIISKNLKESRTYAAGEYSTWNDLYAGKINDEIVIYGSSRAVVQIDPIILSEVLNKSCYNLGIDGHNLWAQHFRHQELLKHNVKPKTIIHSLDLTTLSGRGDLFNAEQFLPYMQRNSSVESFIKNYPVYSYLDYRIPAIRYRGNAVAILHALKLLFGKQPENTGRIKGYEGQNVEWNNDFATAKSKMDNYWVSLDSSAINLFNNYLKKSRDENINIIFVYTPQFIEGQKFVKNKDEVTEVFMELARRYNIPFMDYSNDSISYNRSLFYNTGHLNKKGATLFTTKFGNDLKAFYNEL